MIVDISEKEYQYLIEESTRSEEPALVSEVVTLQFGNIDAIVFLECGVYWQWIRQTDANTYRRLFGFKSFLIVDEVDPRDGHRVLD